VKAGWERKKLIEVTSKIGSGATPKGGQAAYKAEGLSLVRSLNVHDLNFRYKNLAKIDETQAAALANVTMETGDVLLNITGASIARCCVLPEKVLPARVNQHVAIVRPVSDLVDSEFLAYLLISREVKDRLLGIGSEGGSTRQALTKSQLQNFEIPLPPLEEQKLIVAILDEAFAALDRACTHAEANLKNARELFETKLATVFETANPDWLSTTMDQVCDVRDGTHDSPKYVANGIPFVTQKNVRRGGLTLENTKQISEEDHNLIHRRSNVTQGDILISMIGVNRGMACLVDTDEIFSIKNVGLIKAAPGLSMDFLLHFLKSRTAEAYVSEATNGGAQPFIGLKKLRAFPISLPEKSQQIELVTQFASIETEVEKLEGRYLRKLSELEDLRQSLLQKAFAGDLT